MKDWNELNDNDWNELVNKKYPSEYPYLGLILFMVIVLIMICNL